MKKVNRREFIRKVGLGAGIMTLGGMGFADASLLPAGKRRERHDVAVIGTGLAGTVAALQATLSGADVVMIEKVPAAKAGGNSKLAGGLIAIPRDASPEAKLEYFEDFMKKSMGKGNADLAKVLADQSLESVNWLKSLGVNVSQPMAVAGYRVKGVVFAPGLYKGIAAALEKLRGAFQGKGGKIVYATKARSLVMGAFGNVTAVRCIDSTGLKDYIANAVVIATGGYAANKELLELFVDTDADTIMVRGNSWATGDGLYMGHQAGAMLVNMGGMASVHVGAVSPKNTAAGNPLTAVAYTLGINRDGQRYIDESKGYVANGKAAMKQPGQTVALVFDSAVSKEPGVASAMRRFKELGIDLVQADSLDSLAQKIDVSAPQLKETITWFNSSIQDQKAPGARPPKESFAYPVSTPPFYAFYPLVPGITLTFGGLRINQRAQVLQPDGLIIPGLYAAGEGAGGLFYDDYIGGASLANCLVMGRIAGSQAAADKSAKKGRAQ